MSIFEMLRERKMVQDRQVRIGVLVPSLGPPQRDVFLIRDVEKIHPSIGKEVEIIIIVKEIRKAQE